MDDQPKTRRDTKKTNALKKGGVFNAKHIRIQEANRERSKEKKKR